jgi:hypothetical protein
MTKDTAVRSLRAAGGQLVIGDLVGDGPARLS